jgi:hypothetical protein
MIDSVSAASGDRLGIAAHCTRDCAEWLGELGWVQ